MALTAGGAEAGADRIVVDPARVVRRVPPGFLGINVNYFLDDDKNAAAQTGGKAPRTVAAALKEMGVKRLRYPGGDKSDNHLWSVPPYDRPRPTVLNLGTGQWYRGERKYMTAEGAWIADPLDFDEFIALCREVGAEPLVVVCLDAAFGTPRPDFTPPSLARLVETAAAWVRYANVTKRYGVRDWELGNESYHGEGSDTPTAEEYADAAARFTKAMKAVDPAIRIGINGPGHWGTLGAKDRKLGRSTAWWPTVLPAVAPLVDFVVAHTYPCWQWGSYDYFPAHTPDLGREGTVVAEAIAKGCAPADVARLSIAMTEINAADWAKDPDPHWPNVNDLGHALVLADLIGKLLWNPKVENALVWNTRWFGGESPLSIWNALDKDNGLNPTGQAIAIWNRFLADRIVWTEGTVLVPAYASAGADGVLNLLLINKGREPRPVDVQLAAAGRAARWRLRGNGPEDPRPVFERAEDVTPRDGGLALTLEPVSLTILTLPAR